MKGNKLQAVKVIREALEEPRPGLYECMDLVAERFEDLGQRFSRSPTAPLDLDELMAKVRALPHAPAAIEALWDGDSEGWMVYLLAVTIEPRAEHHLAIIQHGTDLRLFNGEVPPWPEAQEASTIGRRLAERSVSRFILRAQRNQTSLRAGGIQTDHASSSSPSSELISFRDRL